MFKPCNTRIPTPKLHWRGYALLATSMALVGSYVALSKPLVAALSVFLLAWLRFGIGGLATLHWPKRPADEPPRQPPRAVWFWESFATSSFSICMLYGVSMTRRHIGGAHQRPAFRRRSRC